MHENLSLSNSRESISDMIDDCTNDCIDSNMSYSLAYGSDVSDMKEKLIVEEDLSPFLQEISHDNLLPEIEQEDQQIIHFPMQEKGVHDPLVFDEYPN